VPKESVNFKDLLTPGQQREILSSRITQVAVEGYQHSLNLEIAKNMGNTQAMDQLEQASKEVWAVVVKYQTELSTVPEE
jgi:hypothetical protein